MAQPLIQTSFTAGEIAPALWGQVDLRRYQTGAAVARNFWVDYRGGLFSRPGTALVATCLPNADEEPPCPLPFVFSQEQSYILELSDSAAYGKIMRIIYRGAVVCETGLAITAVVPDIAGAEFTITGSTAASWLAGRRVHIEGITGLVRDNGVSGVNGQTFIIASVAATDKVKLLDINGQDVTALDWTAFVSGGTAAREVWIAHPWDGAALPELKYAQSADVMTVTHQDYPIYLIRRLSQTDWQITAETFGSGLLQPGNQAVTAVNNDTADPQFFYAYVVTSFNTDTGEQSAPEDGFVAVVNRALDQNAAVVNSLTWSAADGANLYRIYKSQQVPSGYQGSPPYFWGLMGQTESTSFVDTNLEADYTLPPPTNRNPFAGGPIDGTTLDVAGFGYINPVVNISDAAGTGASITATIDAAGAINSPLTIVDGGEGYQAPSVVVIEDRTLYTSGTGLTLAFSDTWVNSPSGPTFWIPAPGSITITTPGSGFHVPRIGYRYSGGGITAWGPDGLLYGTTTGATVTGLGVIGDGKAACVGAPAGGTMTFTIVDTAADVFDLSRALVTATVDDELRNNPATVSFYQQRRMFAASLDHPSTFWMSRPGQYNNFDTSYPTQSDDAITGTVVAGEVNEITSLVSMSTGVVALTAGGAFLISGDGKKAPITPATANASTQTFAGAAPLQPLRVADNLVYLTSQKTAVRDLAYDFFTDVYKGTDLTVLSGHLFQGRDIVQWAWAAEAHKVVAAVRDDGILLTMTYLKEQEVVGWTRNDTNGQFVGVASIPEPGENAIYVIVRRYIFGTGYRYFMERFVRRDFGQNVPLNIPSNPELAWCVDAGARYPLTYPTGTLTSFGFTLGALTTPIIVAGGTGYPTTPFVQVLDPTGTGAEVTVTTTAGVITGVTLVSAGSGYTNPQILVSGGTDGVLSASFENLALFETSGTPWSSGDVGKVLRVGGGLGTAVRYLAGSPALLEFRMDRQVAGLVPNEPAFVLPPSPTGTWSLTTPVSVIGGLEHLEGSTVQIVADGSVVPPQVVVDGCIALSVPATAITAGQGFSCQFQSLRPPDPGMQSRRRSLSSVTLRVVDTRGLFIGNSFTDLVEIKQREDEGYGQPIAFQIGGGPLPPSYTDAPVGQDPIGYDDTITNVGGGWDTQGHVCILQSYPLPAQILATISEITVGDTPG